MTEVTDHTIELLRQVPDGILKKAHLLSVVGSTAHGISVSQEGALGDDLDVSGFYVPPRELLLGLSEAKTLTWRSKAEGERSEAGDVDLTLYPLRKFLGLAFKGNPTILGVPFSWQIPRSTAVGDELRESRHVFVSKLAGAAFKGYAYQQYLRLRGERGQKSVKRPELIDAHGYDVKYAAHVLRLCEQGVTLMEEGYMPMPLTGGRAEAILAVRRGDVDEADALEMVSASLARLDLAIEQTKLPDEPDRGVVNDLSVRLHIFGWTRVDR